MKLDASRLNTKQPCITNKYVALFSSLFLMGNSINCAYADYYVQVAAFKSPNQVQSKLHYLLNKTNQPALVRRALVHGTTYYQVQFGPYRQLQDAKIAKQRMGKIASAGFIRSYNAAAPNDMPVTIADDPMPSPIAPKKVVPPVKVIPPVKVAPLPPVVETIPPPMPVTNYNSFFARFPYNPRALVQGTGGEKSSFFDGDVMLPMLGNNEWIGYADGEIKYGSDRAQDRDHRAEDGDTAWFGSFGVGTRGIKYGDIWGAYVFADRNVSRNNNIFWVINPGLEAMSNSWDAHVNGYFPVSDKLKLRGSHNPQSTTFFQQHTQFERLFELVEGTGAGVDGEVGYTWPGLWNTRTFIGGYHFNINEGPNVNGVEGGIEVPVTNYATILVHDAYDKVQGNTIMGTLRLTFGGLAKTVPADIHNRMLDPLQRHLGAYQTGAGIPIVNLEKQLSVTVVQNNIWFFNPGGTVFAPGIGFNNCTFEHPCGILSQDAVNGVNNLALNANFFINTGVYQAFPGGLTLNNGQSFYGRQAGFTQQAFGANRPIIDNTLFLLGNNNVDSVQVVGNSGAFDVSLGASVSLAGVLVQTAAQGVININNSLITANFNNAADGVVGLLISSDNAVVNLTDSEISVNTVTNVNIGPIDTIGIENFLSAIVNINNSIINVNTTNNLTSNTNTFGVDNVRAGVLSLNNSTVNVAVTDLNGSTGESTGLANFGTSITSINNSIINASLLNFTPSTGLLARGISNAGTGSIINLSQSTVVAQMSGGIGNTATDIFTFAGTATNINASSLMALGNGGSNAISINNSGFLSIAETAVAATGAPLSMIVDNTGIIIDGGGNTCTLNGAGPMPCNIA